MPMLSVKRRTVPKLTCHGELQKPWKVICKEQEEEEDQDQDQDQDQAS